MNDNRDNDKIDADNINDNTFKYLSHGGKHIIFEICNNTKYILRCSRSSAVNNNSNKPINNYVRFSTDIFEKILGTTTYSTLMQSHGNSIMKINSNTLKKLNNEILSKYNSDNNKYNTITIDNPYVNIELNAHYSKEVNEFLQQQTSETNVNKYHRFSIEIKPKSGVLCRSHLISMKNRIKKEKSIYQLQQILKLKKKKIDQISKYDPIDFFHFIDDDKQNVNMKKALKNLFDNPQNNMNIFSIENSTVENVSTTNFKEYFKSNNINNYENIINHLTNILMSNKSQILLKQIYNIQSMDDFDIEGLVKLKLPTFALNTANVLNFKVDNIINDVNNDGIDKTFGKIGSMNINSIINEKIKEDDDHDNNNNVLSNSEKIKIIRRFLLSKTAKDLSLVITTIYPIDNETVNADELETLPFSIKIIDTDFKPIDKFNEWIQKDLNIMNAYFEEKEGK